MNLISTLLRRSLENPQTPLSSPDAWLVDGLGGGPASSGVTVTKDTALTYAAVWRAVGLVSTDIAKMPLHLYVRVPGGGKERDIQHPAYRLMRRKPHPRINAFDFIQTRVGHMMLQGNGYGWIIRDGDGTPMEVAPIATKDVTPALVDQAKWHLVHRDGMPSVRIPDEDMLHFKGLGDDGIQGYDVISFARETFGLGLAAKKFASVFFKNSANANIALIHPSALKPEAVNNLRNEWNAATTGLDKAHRTVLLQEGVQIERLSVDADKAQLMELREFELREVANVMGVPPHKVGDNTRQAFASMEQEQQAYLSESLDGRLCQIEAECFDKLLTEEQKRKETHFFEFKREVILKTDIATMVEASVAEVNNGLLSPDEARAMRNRGPLPNGEGKKFRIPLNIGIVGEDPPDPPPPPPAADKGAGDGNDKAGKDGTPVRDAHRAMFADTFRRMLKRIGMQAERSATNTDTLGKWLAAGLPSHRDVVRDALGPVVRAACSVLGSDAKVSELRIVDDFFVSIRDKLECCPPPKVAELVSSWCDDADAWATDAMETCNA